MQEVDLHGVVSVHITLKIIFEDADRDSVPLLSLDEVLKGLEDCLEGILAL